MRRRVRDRNDRERHHGDDAQPSRSLLIDDLAARALSAPPRCGATCLVCVDGPSGAGKSLLAAELVTALGGPPLVRMDDLYPGWDGLAAGVALLRSEVVAPLAAGRPVRYRRWDWARSAYGEAHDLGMPPLLVVEGVGAGALAAVEVAAADGMGVGAAAAAAGLAEDGAAQASAVDGTAAEVIDVPAVEVAAVEVAAALLVWLDAPEEVRFRRAMERDGATYAPHWARWAAQERTHFAADRTLDRADVALCFR